MKKFIAIFAVIALMLAATAVLVSCGDKGSENSDTTGAVTTSTPTEAEATESNSEPTSEDDSDDSSEVGGSETQDTEPVEEDTAYYDGIPDDTINDIF